MAREFIDAFCIDDQWAAIANNSNISDGNLFGEKAFAFAAYTPCVADGGILSISYLLFVIFASVRLGQLCGRKTEGKGRIRNTGRMAYRFVLVLLIWLIFVYQLVKDELFGVTPANASDGTPAYSTVGDVYMLQPMAPFQLVSRVMSVLGWGLLLIVSAVEIRVFTPLGNWMSTFLGLMDLLCQFVKLYVVLTLYVPIHQLSSLRVPVVVICVINGQWRVQCMQCMCWLLVRWSTDDDGDDDDVDGGHEFDSLTHALRLVRRSVTDCVRT